MELAKTELQKQSQNTYYAGKLYTPRTVIGQYDEVHLTYCHHSTDLVKM